MTIQNLNGINPAPWESHSIWTAMKIVYGLFAKMRMMGKHKGIMGKVTEVGIS
jgi:hypothetical protein